ncbi:two-component system histidine kinase PnpS [Oceanobacillus sojae]|uniref:two-component system histidine kinase PnpS n=1 Tax=Oceanobacillus sojae TaxID=582851 RepID=UPI000988952C|nr:ATP-binding protein [Oceanobacillus sojae]MCT1903449.1 ATP-binding protein [Oceanobacillus sojae]
MKILFSKALFPNILGITIVLILSGWLMVQAEGNWVFIIAIILVEFLVISIIFMQFYNKYTRPLKKASKTVNEMIKGNYSARFYNGNSEEMEQLSKNINKLARNMNEITIQEQMHAEQLTSIIDNMKNGLALIDEKGYVHLVNRGFLEMFHGKEKQYRGHLYYDVFENEAMHDVIQKTFLYEKPVKQQFKNKRGLTKNYMEVIAAPIFNEHNMIKGAVLVIYDITELKRLEKMRKDFVANVSHELRTPITSIRGFAETLKDAQHDEKAAEEFIEIIYKESHRLQLLIEDLLELSRLEREGFQLEKEDFHVKQMIDAVLPSLEQKAKKKELNFTMSISSDVSIHADAEKLKQVIINLVDNAINYTPSGGNVNLKVSEDEHRVHFSVEDTGIGMEQKVLQRVFERFYRVDKDRSRNTGGTGLGLAIVKHIVEVHQGEIVVDSEVNKGTTIHVYIPKD